MALLSSFAYARTRVRQGRTGQRVRLSAVVDAASIGGVFNLTTHWAYGRTSQRAGAPSFAWSDFATPPFSHDVAIPAPTCTEARFCWTPQRNLLLVCNNNGVIEERRSDSDGLDWNTPTETFATGSHPDIFASRAGIVVSLAYRSGEIVGTRQVPSGAVPSAEFTLQDDASADIAVEDDVFRLVEDSRGWWWLHARPAGGGGTQLLFSTDIDVDGASFAETSGSVSGIPSGEAPGLCHAATMGTLYAWARIGTSGWITHRHPGSIDWADPLEMLDEAGDPLEFEAQPFSIAAAFEGPSRLVLAAIIAGESLVSEWWSADPAGESWTRFPSS